MDLGVEGMMLSPGYSYEKAPDQDHFLHRRQTTSLFRRMLNGAKRRWKFNQSPLFIEFLKGNWDLECTPWGSPAYNVFGWQKPCYLLGEGYASSFQELMDSTEWSKYGRSSGNPKCRDCMVHCGYEPSAVDATFRSLKGLVAAARVTLFGALRNRAIDPEPEEPGFSPRPGGPLVELDLGLAASRE
jgi:hopanoid biosynthesis associated radical SAM protein HpnH